MHMGQFSVARAREQAHVSHTCDYRGHKPSCTADSSSWEKNMHEVKSVLCIHAVYIQSLIISMSLGYCFSFSLLVDCFAGAPAQLHMMERKINIMHNLFLPKRGCEAITAVCEFLNGVVTKAIRLLRCYYGPTLRERACSMRHDQCEIAESRCDHWSNVYK